jgi:hypothetical protein
MSDEKDVHGDDVDGNSVCRIRWADAVVTIGNRAAEDRQALQ